jgi:hypothetical protein
MGDSSLVIRKKKWPGEHEKRSRRRRALLKKLRARLEARMRVFLGPEMVPLLSLSVNDKEGLGYPCVSSSEKKTVLHCPALVGSRIKIFSSACLGDLQPGPVLLQYYDRGSSKGSNKIGPAVV